MPGGFLTTTNCLAARAQALLKPNVKENEIDHQNHLPLQKEMASGLLAHWLNSSLEIGGEQGEKALH